MCNDLFLKTKAPYKVKLAAIKTAIPSFAGLKSLRKSDLDTFAQALHQASVPPPPKGGEK
jgi:hypothetical protein